MKEDAINNINLEKVQYIGDSLLVEGFKELKNDEDKNEDLSMVDDFLHLFFKINEDSNTLNLDVIEFSLVTTSLTGADVISLNTKVDTESDVRTLKAFPQRDFRLDTFRPGPDGEARCQVFGISSSATVYKGFTPLLFGYNGRNGLVRSITLYQCNDKILVGETKKCHVYLHDCRHVIYTWHPGVIGEVTPLDILVTSNVVMLGTVIKSAKILKTPELKIKKKWEHL